MEMKKIGKVGNVLDFDAGYVINCQLVNAQQKAFIFFPTLIDQDLIFRAHLV